MSVIRYRFEVFERDMNSKMKVVFHQHELTSAQELIIMGVVCLLKTNILRKKSTMRKGNPRGMHKASCSC